MGLTPFWFQLLPRFCICSCVSSVHSQRQNISSVGAHHCVWASTVNHTSISLHLHLEFSSSASMNHSIETNKTTIALAATCHDLTWKAMIVSLLKESFCSNLRAVEVLLIFAFLCNDKMAFFLLHESIITQ